MNCTVSTTLLENVRYLKENRLDYEALKEWYSDYVPYYYMKLREHMTDSTLLELLNQVGDEKMEDRLQTFESFVTQSCNVFACFSEWNPTELTQFFDALKRRLSEESPLLNKDTYKLLLEAYCNYQKFQELYEKIGYMFTDKICNEVFRSKTYKKDKLVTKE